MTNLLSVIIPAYNVEIYLTRCLDSVIGQTYKNLEIIIVDDGSTDDSGKIADQYAAQDDRIHVIHQENRGLGSARNRGLDIASGDFITFVDSDDWLALNAYETAIYLMKCTGAEIVSFQWIEHFFNDTIVDKSLDKNLFITDHREMMRHYLIKTDQVIDGYQWNKISIRKLWDGLRFRDSHLTHEDMIPTMELLERANSIAVCGQALYHYYRRPDSLTQQSYNPNKTGAILYSHEIGESVRNKYPDLLREAEQWELFFLIDGYCYMDDQGYHGPEREIMRSMFSQYRNTVLKNPYLSVKKKIFFLLIKYHIDFIPFTIKNKLKKILKESSKKKSIFSLSLLIF